MGNLDLTGKSSFAVEVSGSLADGVDVHTGLIDALVQAIALITSEPVRKVLIHLIGFQAEIRIISDRAERLVRVRKFRNIAEVYNKAMLEADSIWYHSEEMKQEYLNMLQEDYRHQFRKLLHSD